MSRLDLYIICDFPLNGNKPFEDTRGKREREGEKNLTYILGIISPSPITLHPVLSEEWAI